MAVHFPLALVVTCRVCIEPAARLTAAARHGAALAIVGTWDLCLGALAALVALATGLAAVIHPESGLRLASPFHCM